MKTIASKGLYGTNFVTKRSFSFPHEVIDDPSLNFDEKRAILSEWASDACAVESLPTLRLLPGTTFPVTYSAIMDAREQLERRQLERIDAATSRGAYSSKTIVWADFQQGRYSPDSQQNRCHGR